MSSFTTPPILKLHALKKLELFAPYTFYRDPPESDDIPYTIEKIVVPIGFITDLASIPRCLWSILPPHDYYAKAAILHDYLYKEAIGTKKEADRIFYEALLVTGMKKWLAKLFYLGVKLGGKGNY